MEEGINVFSIKDLENFSGIKAHTIRIWEKRYSVLVPERTDSNIRTYSEEELKKILNVAYLNRNGYKISKIANFDDDQLNQKVMEVSSQKDLSGGEFEPGKILMSAIKFNESLFKETLNQHVKRIGLEEAFPKLLSPLLEKARILWQTGTLSRAQEQFIRNTIRQMIIIEDSVLAYNENNTKGTVAMVNTSDNHLENNFLFYKYMLKKRGYDVIFTGGILPASEVIEIYNIKPFKYMIINGSSFGYAERMGAYFNNLGKSLMVDLIIITDSAEDAPSGLDRVITSRDPYSFMRSISNLR
jgi:MerR family transcriptional regulator, light-induced transcriptional regulator